MSIDGQKIEDLERELSELRAGVREARALLRDNQVHSALLVLDELGEESE